MKIQGLLLIGATILFPGAFFSCSETRTSGIPYDGTIYQPEYSKGFTIYRSGEYSSVLEIRNPWQGAQGVSDELFISCNGEQPPAGFNGNVVAAPLKNVVCMSSTYVAFIDKLGETNSITGVSGARYISNDSIVKWHSEGKVRDVGYDTNINYELIANLRPDIVLIYGVAGENTSVTNKLKELGIPVTYIADYLEEEPLGKAEWLVAFGEMYGKREFAEAHFARISETYGMWRGRAEGLPQKPSVMLNAPYRDVWFVPGDRSYMVKLIEDAGGAYAFAGMDNSVSRPISSEAAWMTAQTADVWINPNQARTMEELKSQNPKFANVPCVESGRVFNCTKRSTEAGGSDFWESGAVNPDIVLRDLIICLHPEASGDWGEQDTYYFERIK